MNVIRYCQPASLIRELQHELFPFMSELEREKTNKNAKEALWMPKVDIQELENEFVVYADIPGVDPADIDINVENNLLSVKGERKTFLEEQDKEKNYYRVERSFGKFHREFTLPESVDGSKISAKVKQGVLAIHLPKETQKTHQRKINVEQEA